MKRRVSVIALVVFALLALVLAGRRFYGFILNDELNQAAQAADVSRIDKLLSAGADINGAGMHAMKPLMSACKGGDLRTVEHLLTKGADINSHNDSGSALMWVIESNKPDIVRLLLEHHVDVDWRNCLGQDARSFAREEGNGQIIELLR